MSALEAYLSGTDTALCHDETQQDAAQVFFEKLAGVRGAAISRAVAKTKVKSIKIPTPRKAPRAKVAPIPKPPKAPRSLKTMKVGIEKTALAERLLRGLYSGGHGAAKAGGEAVRGLREAGNVTFATKPTLGEKLKSIVGGDGRLGTWAKKQRDKSRSKMLQCDKRGNPKAKNMIENMLAQIQASRQ